MHRLVRPGLGLVLILVNIWLVAPLLGPGESPYRDSIGPGYASMAAFFRDHPNPWGWHPYQYTGHPAQSTYLPVAPYLSALLSHLPCFDSVIHASRALFLVAASLIPVTWFLYFSRSGASPVLLAFGAMLAFTLVSPEYLSFRRLTEIGASPTCRGGCRWSSSTAKDRIPSG